MRAQHLEFSRPMRVKDQPDLQYWLQTGAGLAEAPPEPQELQLAGQTSLQPSPGSALYKLTVGQVGPAGGRNHSEDKVVRVIL